MTGLGVGSALSRRTMVAMVFAGLAFTAVSVQAQDAPPAAPAQETAPAPQAEAPAAPAEDLFKFSSDAALIIWYIKPDQTAAFETVWNAIRAKLAASEKPELRELGDSLKVFKSTGEATPQGVNYFFVADPASKTQSYSPSPFLLFETGMFEDAEARELLAQLQGTLNGINPLPLDRIDVTPLPPAAPAAPAAPDAPAAPAAPATPAPGQ